MMGINANTVVGEGAKKKEKLFPEVGGVFFTVTTTFKGISIDNQYFNGNYSVTFGNCTVTACSEVLRK